MKHLDQDCISQFKFDDPGTVNAIAPASRLDADFAAMIQLIDDLHATKSNTFIGFNGETFTSDKTASTPSGMSSRQEAGQTNQERAMNEREA